MSTIKRSIQLNFLLLLCCLTNSKAYPTQTDSTEKDTLSSVFISALKDPHANPLQSVTVIEKKELENYHNLDIGQLLNQKSGINVNGSNNNLGQDKNIYIRGLKNKHVLILLDGMPLNDNSGIGGVFDIRFIPTEQIERVEIVKGALATLYGSQAIGGVINIITKENNKKDSYSNIETSYGSYNRQQLSASHGGYLSKKLSYYINAQNSQYEGPSAAKDTSKTTNFDKDGGILQSINANLNYLFNPHLKLKLSTLYNKYKIDTDQGAFTDDSSTYKAEIFNIGTELHHSKNEKNFTVRHNFTNTKREFSGNFISKYKSLQSNTDIFTSLPIFRKLKESSILFGATRRDFFLEQNDKLIDEYAMEGYANIAIKYKNISINSGGRISYYKSFALNNTGSFGIGYNISKDIRIKTLIGTSFRAPTLDELFSVYGGNKNLNPEKGLSYEAGIEGQFKKNIQYSIVGFKNDITNEIIYTSGYQNTGETNTKGIETDLQFYLSKSFNINGNYTFTETNRSGENTALRTPKHRINFDIYYSPIKKLKLNSTISYRSDQWDYLSPTSSIKIKAYTVTNLNISYLKNKNLNLFVNITNLFNEKESDRNGYTTMPRVFLGGLKYTL